MTNKARAWTGATLLFVLAFNYALVAFPLISKSASIQNRYKIMMLDKVRSGKFLKTDDEYILEVFKKEKASVDRKVLILNCVAASFVILIGSWTVFGLIVHRKSK